MKVILSDSSQRTYKVSSRVPGTSLLLSYWYGKTSVGGHVHREIRDAKRAKTDFFFVDSGVFSARKTGSNITVRELVEYYDANKDIISFMFNLDTGNHAQQLDNCKMLKAAGVPVIGIYHGDMPIDYIKRFADINPYVAISYFAVSSGIAHSLDNLEKYHQKIFGYLHKNNMQGLPLHLLGLEKKDVLIKYPAYSCDATSYISDYMFGKLSYFCEKEKRLKNIDVGSKVTTQKLEDALGISSNAIGMLRDCGRDGIAYRVEAAVKSRVRFQEYLTQVWQKRGVIWDDEQIFKSTR